MPQIFLLVALSIFLLFILQKRRKDKKTLRPPGPPGLPFFGNLHQLDTSDTHRYLWKLSQKYGPLLSIRLGFVPVLVISSSKMAEQVFKTHDLNFSSRPTNLGQRRLSYNRLDLAFSPFGEYWREMRKICVLQLLSAKRVQSFRSVREDEVSQMIKKISNYAALSKLVNLNEMAMSFTGCMIYRVAFGKTNDLEGSDLIRFHHLLSDALAMIGGLFISDYFPLTGWIDRVTGMCAKLEKVFKSLDMFYQQIIDEHLNPARLKHMQEDVIDILLELKKDYSTGVDLTVDHIKAILMVITDNNQDIIVAGTDTSAVPITWAMTALMKNSNALKKVQAEVRNLVGMKGKVDEDDIQNLPYLKAMVKETLRLYPPAPLLVPRETTESFTINGYEIEAKTMVYINAWAIGRDPETWKNPEEFCPERFLDSDIDYRGKDFEFIPFGGGRRGCPGINLAMTAVEIALANLLYSFDWELPLGMRMEDVDTGASIGLSMQIKNALCLVAKKKY